MPKYNPTNKEYGCLADAPSLLCRLKILDKAQPETQATTFGNVKFDASLALDTPGSLPLVQQPGSDGFTLSSSPLFQVAAGREWFIHAIYALRSRENGSRGKRSLEYHHAISTIADSGTKSRSRRAVPGPEAFEIGAENNRGTNIQHIALDRSNRLRVSQPWGRENYLEHAVVEGSLGKGPGSDSSLPTGTSTFLGVAGLILLVCLVVVLLVLLMRSKRKEKKYPPYSTSSCTAYNGDPMRHNVDSSEV